MTDAARMAANRLGLIDVAGLRIAFPDAAGRDRNVVDGVSLRLNRGEALGIVGESGSGKTMIALSLLGLVPRPGRVTVDRMSFEGADLAGLDEAGWRDLRGRRIAMVFQNPMSGFNPVRTIGQQLARAVQRHASVADDVAFERSVAALASVGIAAPGERARAYPHQMSGGMLQRAMIALALINHPDVVLADEPTTALDATVQAQILELLATRLEGAALLLVTHNLGVAAQLCRRVAVVYAGRVAETGSTAAVLNSPQHPYTQALVRAAPRLGTRREALTPIPGQPPGPQDLVAGCRFARRCPRASARCDVQPPLVEGAPDTFVACWHPGGPA
ncbi:MAG TPA: ABC transporter ATP-binding protein [Steroidobacteraceae bacterium]|nr:ABC transporter ATP-binding protein [Steroidobacteraceae bacterium]